MHLHATHFNRFAPGLTKCLIHTSTNDGTQMARVWDGTAGIGEGGQRNGH